MPGRRGASVEHRSLLLISAVAALFAGLAYQLLFSRGSLNNDEVAYLLQGEAITRGELFLDVPQPAAAHRIWFFVERDPGLVSKYLPLVSAVFALGLGPFGTVLPVLVVLAACLPWLVAGLAQEAGLDGGDARRAALLVSFSPIVLMQSAIPLGYLLFLVMITAAWLMLLRVGHGRAGPGCAAGLGALITAAGCIRPYDTVLLMVPGMLWAVRRRHKRRCMTVGFAAGALPGIVAVAWYNNVATGAPWRLPFGLFEGADKIGFGVRRLYPEQSDHYFGPLQGLVGLVLHFAAGLLTWLALGVALLPAAARAWRHCSPAVRVLLASVVVHLAGYSLFWGPWNFSWVWGNGTRVLGPIYAMPLVVPLTVAGVPVLRAQWGRGGRRVRATVVVAAAVTVIQIGSAVNQAAVDAARTRLLLDHARAAAEDGPLLLDTDPPYLGHPVSQLIESVVLSVAHPVPAAGEPTGQLLQLPKAVYGTGTLVYALTHQRRVEAPRVVLSATIVAPKANVLVAERDGRTSACRLVSGTSVPLELTTTGIAGCEGLEVPEKWRKMTARRCADTSCVSLAAYRVDDDGDETRLTWRLLPVTTSAGRVALLVDGEVAASGGHGWLRVTSA